MMNMYMFMMRVCYRSLQVAFFITWGSIPSREGVPEGVIILFGHVVSYFLVVCSLIRFRSCFSLHSHFLLLLAMA